MTPPMRVRPSPSACLMREAISLMRHAISLLRHAISPSLAQRVPDEGGNQSDEACKQYVPGVNERRGAVVSTRILGQELRAWKPLNVLQLIAFLIRLIAFLIRS